MSTVPFATGPGGLDSQFLPMKSFEGVLNQVVPHLSEENRYVDIHFVEVKVLEMEPGQAPWPHPTATINFPYFLGRNGKPLDISAWGKFVSSVVNAGATDLMLLIGKKLSLASVFEKYTDRSGNERRNQIWEIQSLAGTSGQAQVGEQPAPDSPFTPQDGTEAPEQDALLLEMIDGSTHADFAQKVLNSSLRSDQNLVNGLMDQTLVARLINEGKVVEEDERYRVVKAE